MEVPHDDVFAQFLAGALAPGAPTDVDTLLSAPTTASVPDSDGVLACLAQTLASNQQAQAALLRRLEEQCAHNQRLQQRLEQVERMQHALHPTTAPEPSLYHTLLGTTTAQHHNHHHHPTPSMTPDFSSVSQTPSHAFSMLSISHPTADLFSPLTSPALVPLLKPPTQQSIPPATLVSPSSSGPPTGLLPATPAALMHHSSPAALVPTLPAPADSSRQPSPSSPPPTILPASVFAVPEVPQKPAAQPSPVLHQSSITGLRPSPPGSVTASPRTLRPTPYTRSSAGPSPRLGPSLKSPGMKPRPVSSARSSPSAPASPAAPRPPLLLEPQVSLGPSALLLSTPAPKPPPGKHPESTKAAEQQRRNALKTAFDQVRQVIPGLEHSVQIRKRKAGGDGGSSDDYNAVHLQRPANLPALEPGAPKAVPKLTVLKAAHDYILYLRARERALVDALRRADPACTETISDHVFLAFIKDHVWRMPSHGGGGDDDD